jgi:hypothetical protein
MMTSVLIHITSLSEKTRDLIESGIGLRMSFVHCDNAMYTFVIYTKLTI